MIAALSATNGTLDGRKLTRIHGCIPVYDWLCCAREPPPVSVSLNRSRVANVRHHSPLRLTGLRSSLLVVTSWQNIRNPRHQVPEIKGTKDVHPRIYIDRLKFCKRGSSTAYAGGGQRELTYRVDLGSVGPLFIPRTAPVQT